MIKGAKVHTITIGGQDYPAFANVALLMELQDEGIDLDTIMVAEGSQKWRNFARLIKKIIDKGYQAKGEDQTVSEDDILDTIDIASIPELTDQLGVLFGSKGRTVQAEPPKN